MQTIPDEANMSQAPMSSNYENQAQQESDQGSSSKSQKSRHRASVACATCRERRIRCVVPAGEASCAQCTRSGQECIIKNDDERRRPISRAYMSTLTDRVSLLESMLKERGAEPPPVVYPPKTTRGSLQHEGDPSPVRSTTAAQQDQTHRSHGRQFAEDTSPGSAADEAMQASHLGSQGSVEGQRDPPDHDASQGTPMDDKNQGLVSRLLSTRGHLSFDQISGRLRYFGPTVNSHIYSELEIDDAKSTRETHEQARRAEKIIRTLPLETHEYLLQLFWQHYNSVLHVVHQEAFEEDYENGRTQFYSGFLHITMLAMGFRFSDKTRPDMQRIALPNRESTLHREAKYMLDLELERPGGVCSIAALLILGDSEVGVGRDSTGWMYAGMAMRLCYDLGLHLDSRQTGLSARETDIRRMTLWACVIYDRYWSLFLGRATTMKTADIEIYSLAAQFERLGTCKPAGPEKSLNTRIYEALIELMEIAGKIVENAEHRKQTDALQNIDQALYFRMAAIDRDLHNWAARLPQDLRYTEENRALDMPFSFYLLHQQYHAALILLHRPFARYDDSSAGDTDDNVSALDKQFSNASRAICTKSAIAISRIFWQHRQRFDGKQIFCIGMQHTSTAATALIAALAYIPDAADRTNNLQYLEVLHAAMQDMSHAYQPAERMAAVLDAVMIELRGGPMSGGKTFSSHSSSIPARRDSTALEAGVERPSMKRRQTGQTNRPKQSIPLPTSSRQHRASDASDHHSISSQQMQQHGDFVMITPRTEGSAMVWPNTFDNHNTTENGALPGPGSTEHQTSIDDFPSLPSMLSMHDGPESGELMNLEFFPQDLSLDDWEKWHAGPSDPSADLDGFPPRFKMHNLASPPMHGTIL